MKTRASRVVYLNGRFIRASAARVSAEDRGLLYGDGIFETIRIYHGRPFALEAHLARLREAGERIRLEVPGDAPTWATTIQSLVRRNGLTAADSAVRLTITRGEAGRELLPARRVRPTILLSARRLPPELGRWQRKGISAILLPFSPGSDRYLAAVKAIGYLTAIVGRLTARERRAFEGMYTTADGAVLEGTTSNVFAVVDRRLITPPEAGILPGVTRAEVLRLAGRVGLEPCERKLLATELEAADEAFLTASTIEIVPIRALDGHPVGRGGHRLTRQLQEEFRAAVSAYFSGVPNLGTSAQFSAKTVSRSRKR